jgi:sialate O-acetylesterase
MMLRYLPMLLIAWSTMSSAAVTRAAVRLPNLFSDDMVLQRDKPNTVWGWADAGESVAVTFAGRTATTVADAAGRWQLDLPALPADRTEQELEVRGTNVITLRRVLVGDVWLCSGQSNMSISVGHFFAVPEVKQDLATAKYPLIRHFGVKEHFADQVQDDVAGKWSACTPQTASQFCAVGFYFARKVHAATGVPIGLVRSAKGSTTIELWISQATLLNTPQLEPFAVKMRDALSLWDRNKAVALRNGIQADSPEFPPFPFGEKVRRPRCVTLHNGMIAPLTNFGLRGVLWYQGEGNAGDVVEAQQYAATQHALIAELRRLFRNESLPFYFVQLPAYRAATDEPAGGDAWSMLRESQRTCLSLPHTGMAVAVDIGDADDIHPTNKADVGERLAAWALRNEYGQADTMSSGPLFRRLSFEGNAVRVHVDSVGAGLMVGRKEGRAPVVEDRNAKLQRFAVAGADRQWHWAEATIDGETVLVQSPAVAAPIAVRYAFSANPAGANLYNRSGLPASPFRSDDW